MITIKNKAKVKHVKLGLGGSCHWCTEAIFQSLSGVDDVEQGWISSMPPDNSFSEAIIVSFCPEKLDIHSLIDIHLHTHSCTANHSMRDKYRSAIYYFSPAQKVECKQALTLLQGQFPRPIVTQVLPFVAFKSSPSHYQNYYQQDPQRPFCKNVISPKLDILRRKYSPKLK